MDLISVSCGRRILPRRDIFQEAVQFLFRECLWHHGRVASLLGGHAGELGWLRDDVRREENDEFGFGGLFDLSFEEIAQ